MKHKHEKVCLEKLKIAIVYDRVNKWGGAERVLLILNNLFPDAPLYTSVYNQETARWAKVFSKVHTSFLQKINFARKWHQGFGWMMPFVFENLDFSNYDLVISVTSEAAKGIITKPETTHVCYLLTPTRYLWSHYNLYFKNPILKFISRPVVNYLKKTDVITSSRPDKIITISTETQNRIKKYYNRNSEIIFPPVNNNDFCSNFKIHSNLNKGEYYLYVGRLEVYKRVDLLVEVFNKIDRKLIIVGHGNQFKKLKNSAGKNIVFTGEVSENELQNYYRNARALLMVQEEDFGLVSIEAQNYGIPVIAYGKGGSLDSVINGKTGILFASQSCEAITSAIAKFEKISFNHKYICENAKKFSEERFKREFQRSLIHSYLGGRRRNSSLAEIEK